MKRGGYRSVLMGTVLLAASSGLWAAGHYKVVNGPKDFYYGHISYIEATAEGTDPVVLREGREIPEQAVLNLPIGPGDTVRTSADRRCEIQFDSGTIVRLDFETEVKVETILARSLSSLQELSNLALNRGRVYVMYKEYDRHEMFQFLTPNAAVKMKHNSVAVVAVGEDGSTDTQVKYGKARLLYGADVKLLKDREVNKGERLIVQKDSQFQLAAYIADTAFELWNKDVNAHFEDLHEGVSSLPKPIQRLPGAVFYFAQTYGNRYGEWLWDDLYGYAWRPFLNDGRYPWGWQPYYYGQWSYAGGQMFWVPQEPWGWIPYHLGVWQWDKKHGWFWLPGSMFAPAWVDWDFYFGYAGWRPWSLFDWMDDCYPYGMSGFAYLNGDWRYDPFYVDNGPGASGRRPLNTIRKDQLKQPAVNPYPVPSELRGLLKKVTAAFERGDARIRDSANDVPRHLVFVAKDDLKARAVNEKALSWDRVPKSGAPAAGEAAALRRPSDPRREAARLFRGLDGPAAVPRRISAPAPKTVEGGSLAAVPAGPSGRPEMPVRRGDASAARFRDWNPDLRVARELGVHIEYSSVRNEIRCPELKFSSRDRERASGFAPHMTSRGVSYGPAVSVGGEYAGGSNPTGSSASSGQSPTRGQSERSSASSGSRESKGSEGGKIKN